MNHSKLKVLFIAKNIPVKGTHLTRIVIDIAHKITAFCDVTFLYPNEKVPFGLHFVKKYKPFYNLTAWDFEGFHVSVSNYLRLPFRKMAFWLWNKLSNKDIQFYKQNGPFDLIHAHYLFPDGYLAYLYSVRFKIPYVITIRNSDIRQLKSLSNKNPDFKKARLIIENANRILTLNLSYKEFIDELFEISSQIIPHGIEESAFVASPKKENKGVVITTVSSAIKRKNIDWIIEAFKNYHGKQTLALNIIGSGPIIDQLKLIAEDDRRIIFHGKLERSSVIKYLENSDIFALPSNDESFGLVYLEAAATQNAILGLQNEGVWGIFADKDEMLFSKDKPNFQELLHQLIDDEVNRKRLKENAFNKAKRLSWDNITRQYENAYKESLESFKANSQK